MGFLFAHHRKFVGFFGMKIAMRAWNFDGFIGKFGVFFFEMGATIYRRHC